jgi:hypothetical protein
MTDKRDKKRSARPKRVRDPRVEQLFRDLWKIRWPIEPNGEPDPHVQESPDAGARRIH